MGVFGLVLRAKWIAGFLASDLCLRTMTGEDSRLIGQGVEILADRVEELLVVPAGEVGPADTSVKQGVTRKEDGLGDEVKGDRFGRVSGNVREIKFEPGDFKGGLAFEDGGDLKGRNVHGNAHFLNAFFHDDIGRVRRPGRDPGASCCQKGAVFDVIKVLVG